MTAESGWADSMPDDAAFHLRLSADGWIMMDCEACQRPLVAATHMDLWGWIRKAEEHYRSCHADGMPETGYVCPRCAREATCD